ncbi:hypothetical protein [Fischerella sp. PCC 9605]|uniref:hypothetical protein n=1 Tax=Fischerella sp. PCC 9605 TaxID=1173024 RepID=UPI00047A8944|nr:hypothetical protein [Fischerella sp. PCC 9605]
MSRRNEFTNVIAGAFLVLGMHILAIVIFLFLILLESVIGYALAINFFLRVLIIYLSGIGITQLVYIIPVIFILKRREKFPLMKGVIVGAVITALLNGGCWIFFLNQTS